MNDVTWRHMMWDMFWMMSWDLKVDIIDVVMFFYFGIFLKFITITYNVGLAWFLCHWVSKKHVMPMQVYRSFGEKKIWRLEVNINFGINFHLFLENSHFISTKVESWVICINEFVGRSTISVGDFRPFGDKCFWTLFMGMKRWCVTMHGVGFTKFFITNFLYW